MFTAQRYHMFTAQRYHYRADQYSLKILQSRLLTTRAFCEFARACAPRDGAPRLAAKQKISTSQRLSTFTKPFAERLSKPQRRQPHRESVGKRTENTLASPQRILLRMGALRPCAQHWGPRVPACLSAEAALLSRPRSPVCVCVCVCVSGVGRKTDVETVCVCVCHTLCVAGHIHGQTDRRNYVPGG